MVLAAINLLLVAQPEMDAEIHGQADEQHGEGDRDQVEMADGEGGEGGGPGQAHEKRGQGRKHQSCRAQADEQERAHQHQRQHPGHTGAGAHAFQLLVGDGGGPGQAHAHPMFVVQFKLPGKAADGRHRRGGRLQGLEVEHGLNQNEAPAVPRLHLAPPHQLLPGQGPSPALKLSLDGVGDVVENGVQVSRRLLAIEDVIDGEAESVKKSAQAQVLGERGEQRLGPGQPVGQVVELLQIEIQGPVLDEERIAGGVIDGVEQVGPLFQAVGQRRRRIVGQIHVLAVDDHQDRVGELGEGLLEMLISLTERQTPRQHVGGIGVDAEIACRVDERRRTGQHRHDHHQPRHPPDGVDPPDHGFAIRLGSLVYHRRQSHLGAGCRAARDGLRAKAVRAAPAGRIARSRSPGIQSNKVKAIFRHCIGIAVGTY